MTILPEALGDNLILIGDYVFPAMNVQGEHIDKNGEAWPTYFEMTFPFGETTAHMVVEGWTKGEIFAKAYASVKSEFPMAAHTYLSWEQFIKDFSFAGEHFMQL